MKGEITRFGLSWELSDRGTNGDDDHLPVAAFSARVVVRTPSRSNSTASKSWSSIESAMAIHPFHRCGEHASSDSSLCLAASSPDPGQAFIGFHYLPDIS